MSRRVTRSICIKREEHLTERQQAKEPGQRQKREETAKSFLRSGSYEEPPHLERRLVQAQLGVAGYSLDARRLAAATIVLCVVAIFFDLAVSQGLSSGVEGYDRGSQPRSPAPRTRLR